MAGRLFVVATPLGNAEDCSPRARRVLAEADLVLAEDTRRAGMLFQRLGITRKDGAGFVSFHEHNEAERVGAVVARLEAGEDVAIISDAGTPLISDPGYRLVAACRESGIGVVPVPGPSAVTAALSAAGLPPLPFTFLGFLPRKSGQVSRLFELHKPAGTTLVFFERKSRLAESLTIALKALGPREACIARELTKDYEEFLRLTLGPEEIARVDGMELKGEVTVVLGPPPVGLEASEEDVLAVIAEEREAGGKPKEVARRAAARLPGFTAKTVYEMMRRS